MLYVDVLNMDWDQTRNSAKCTPARMRKAGAETPAVFELSPLVRGLALSDAQSVCGYTPADAGSYACVRTVPQSDSRITPASAGHT